MLGPTARLVARQSMSPTGSSCENFRETPGRLPCNHERENEEGPRVLSDLTPPLAADVRADIFILWKRKPQDSLCPGECLFH